MIAIFRVQIEAERKQGDRILRFGMNMEISPLNSSDWIGNLFVKACSKEAADQKIRGFLLESCDSWQYDVCPEVVESMGDYPLDMMAIIERGDLHKLDYGEVIQGWGL